MIEKCQCPGIKKKIDPRLVAAACKPLPCNATGMSDKYVDTSENTGQKKVMLK